MNQDFGHNIHNVNYCWCSHCVMLAFFKIANADSLDELNVVRDMYIQSGGRLAIAHMDLNNEFLDAYRAVEARIRLTSYLGLDEKLERELRPVFYQGLATNDSRGVMPSTYGEPGR